MSKKSLYIFGILLTILIGTYFYWKICCQSDKKKDEDKKEVVTEVPSVQRNGFAVSSDAGSGINYSTNDNYNFVSSGSEILLPLSAKVAEGVSKAKAFMDENPSQVMSIVGHYKSSETNNSAFPDLGLARANAVKNHLLSTGVGSKSVLTSSQLDDEFVVSSDTLYGPVTFGLSAASADGTDWAVLGDKIRDNPLVLYFNTSEASINLTKEQKQKVADISNYVDHVEGAKCLAIGHTDSQGNRANNVRLGANRADFAKTYLVRNGMRANSINVSSKGPDVPVADNGTKEGRAKNRRTVVTINK